MFYEEMPTTRRDTWPEAWRSMPHFHKKWKLIKRECHECWAHEHDVYLVVTPLKDFYICEQCKKAYDEIHTPKM